MTAPLTRPPGAAFAGIESHGPTLEQRKRANLHTKRHWRNRRIGEKLDALLGSVDEDPKEPPK